jgi:prolipoprotein diacylglyceryltransferase
VANQLAGVPLGVALHPTQLCESAAEFVIISLYLVLYGSVRFLVEFVRFHEQPNPFGGPLNTSQWISLARLALGASYFLRARKRHTAAVAG